MNEWLNAIKRENTDNNNKPIDDDDVGDEKEEKWSAINYNLLFFLLFFEWIFRYSMEKRRKEWEKSEKPEKRAEEKRKNVWIKQNLKQSDRIAPHHRRIQRKQCHPDSPRKIR